MHQIYIIRFNRLFVMVLVWHILRYVLNMNMVFYNLSVDDQRIMVILHFLVMDNDID